MLNLTGCLLPDFLLNQGPPADALLFLGLILFMLELVAVVSQVEHQLLLFLDILFVVLIDRQPKIPRME